MPSSLIANFSVGQNGLWGRVENIHFPILLSNSHFPVGRGVSDSQFSGEVKTGCVFLLLAISRVWGGGERGKHPLTAINVVILLK